MSCRIKKVSAANRFDNGIKELTSTNVGIVVEPGIRFMLLPEISGDLAYRFRYVAIPSFTGNNVKVSFNSLNSAIVFRVDYHLSQQLSIIK